ncbi:MAG TPA: glycosyltransferase [Planctomycetota bacterium]|nr:glycosyltransferase [Planctomycetota bacterium]
MLIALFVLSILASVALLGWLFIFFHPARPWDFFPVGDDEPVPADAVDRWPAVCILVPARNEAQSLPRTLPALLSQDYPGAFRVILIDDRSSDETSAVALKIAADLQQSTRLEVLSGKGLPEGWVGKMWALQQGASRALGTDGGSVTQKADYVLLTDADIFHEKQSLRRLVLESQSATLALNSRMARLRCSSPAERLLIPAFVYFFNLLYPMRRVNNPSDPLAAAAGGCVLLSREALEKMGGGFEPIKAEIIDDVNLGRTVKGHGLPIRLSLSRTEVRSLRDYPLLGDIWHMVRRTAFTELKFSWLRLAGALCGLFLLFVVPVAALIGGALGVLLASESETLYSGAWACSKGLISLLLMRAVYSPAVRFFELPGYYAFSLPVAGVLYGLMTLDSALRYARGIGPQWREPSVLTAETPKP